MEKKILFKPEFEYYHSLLTMYGEELLENKRQTFLTVNYDDNSRILEFTKKYSGSSIEIIEDGTGGVIIKFSNTPYSEVDNLSGGVTVTIG